MSANVVAFGPSMIDICAPLDEQRYDSCHDILHVNPGEWKLIEESAEVEELMDVIRMPDIDMLTTRRLTTDPYAPTLAAGSSTLGMLGALPPTFREQSTLVTALAMSNGRKDRLSEYFVKEVQKYGIKHDGTVVEGHNPVGFVLYNRDDVQGGEKTLAMYPGVAQHLSAYDALDSKNPALVLIDTYELKHGELQTLLDRIINQGMYRIALSLGNHSLLGGELQQRVRGYVENGLIDTLCGNEEEYRALYPELDKMQTKRHYFEDHPVGKRVAHALLTRGPRGLDALWDGVHYYSSAYNMSNAEIVNTSGAGDTAMGVFCGGVLENAPVGKTLAKAAYYAGRVLSRASSMILAEH